MSILAAGAGLLARGVSALFSGRTSEERQARRAERQAKREDRRGARTGLLGTQQYERQVQRYEGRAPLGYEPPVISEPPPRGDVERGSAATRPSRTGKTDYMELAKKYWWAIALVVLFFTPFGKKLMKPTRRAPRRRPKPKEIIRYRTRKAPVKARR